METKVLFYGTKEAFKEGEINNITDITSSVTLLKAGNFLSLIDSGSFFYREKLINELKKNSVEAGDIDFLFLTHLHLDHTGNVFLFKNAKIIEERSIIDLKSGLHTVYPRVGDVPLPDDLQLMETSGHIAPCSSIVLREKGKKTVFSGDAIRHEMMEENYLPGGQDVLRMIDSAIKICKIADVIIPGHGRAIEKKEIVKIGENLKRIKREMDLNTFSNY